jgi:hypothetical protein
VPGVEIDLALDGPEVLDVGVEEEAVHSSNHSGKMI